MINTTFFDEMSMTKLFTKQDFCWRTTSDR